MVIEIQKDAIEDDEQFTTFCDWLRKDLRIFEKILIEVV